ncbi:MAG: glycosyltransferase family 39 protein [Bradyrhizobium sp.]|nr:glycosyltransferase family 39 protein [Bradyrhizobium sp.]
MAARSDANPARWRLPLISWLNGVETGWGMPLLLAGFVAAWTTYLVIAYWGSGLHPDVLETWTLGRRFEWGYPKHPPLMGWIARGWTSLFPLTDWSLRLMAMVNAAVALWAVDLIAKRFVTGEKRVVILLLLMLTPVYQFHAQRFNANSVLLAIWPIATYCFLRSFEERRATWAIAAGVATAVAMLGKYYSVFLVSSFVLAASLHPARRTYFLSKAPWISVAAGLATLAPHLHWLVATGAEPFDYALAHARASFPAAITEVFFFLTGLAATMLPAVIAWTFIAGYRLKQWPDEFRAMSSGLWLLVLIFCGTIALPIATSLVFGTDLPSLWAVQGLFLFVVPAVCCTPYSISRFHAVNLAVLAGGASLAAVIVAAPVHAYYRNERGYEEGRNLYRPAAVELTRLWRETTGTPLQLVSGDDALAFGAAFYSPDHPYYARPFLYQHTWRIPRKTTLERGWAALCFADQTDCIAWMRQTAERAGRYVQVKFDAQAELLGMPGVRRGIVALLVPPLAEPAPSTSNGSEDFSAIRRAME